jgi:hypothetical protein
MVIKCYKVTLVIHENYATRIYARKKSLKKLAAAEVTNWGTIGM